jgi:glycosyltransferase involved in cell wall biosynthesis
MPKLSIVIPTLKEEGYIVGTIEQFKALSVPHEVIVSDGGSLDRTVELATPLVNKITVMKDGKPTPARQRNDGAKLATGEFLAFVDSSVQIPDVENFFSRAIAKFDADPSLTGVTGRQNIFPEIETWADWFFLNCQNLAMRIQNNVLHRGAGTGKFMFMRRKDFEQIHGFREDLVAGEDLDLVLRLSRIGKTEYCSDLQIYYPGRREHGLGWVRLIWIWTINVWWIWLFDKAYNKEWNPVR